MKIQKETSKGVLVGDKELEDLEREIVDPKKSEEINKPVVYKELKINEKEAKLLSVSPVPKVNIEEFGTEMKKCVIKYTCLIQRKMEIMTSCMTMKGKK